METEVWSTELTELPIGADDDPSVDDGTAPGVDLESPVEDWFEVVLSDILKMIKCLDNNYNWFW